MIAAVAAAAAGATQPSQGELSEQLARPRQLVSYQTSVTLPRLAAALCIGTARNHAFVDANKRVALLAMCAFSSSERARSGRGRAGGG